MEYPFAVFFSLCKGSVLFLKRYCSIIMKKEDTYEMAIRWIIADFVLLREHNN